MWCNTMLRIGEASTFEMMENMLDVDRPIVLCLYCVECINLSAKYIMVT